MHPDQTQLLEQTKELLRDPLLFAEHASKLKLRKYQQEVAWAVVRSVIAESGLSFVVIFPRQSGKNECQAQLETYLLTLFSQYDFDMVKISPTWKPQSINAMLRIERVLSNNIFVSELWRKEQGYIYQIGKTRIAFLSGEPTAHIVGATASLLLEVDETQDVSIEKYDKEIAPMAASTNATRIFWGTAWTSQTLLARELRAARQSQEKDGLQRVFMLNADQVTEEVPAYGVFVAEQIAKLGRNHPMIRTQYFSEEIDAQAGMFPPARRALMLGNHTRQDSPYPGTLYAFLIDCAGQDEAKRQGLDSLQNKGRDATTLTIVEVDLSNLAILQSPTYRPVMRRQWTGDSPVTIFGQIKALAEGWNARHIVIDATGVGEGLFALLDKSFPGKVIPVKFTQPTKSEIGWGWISIIETGRWREYVPFDPFLDAQLDYCQMEILSGPQKFMRWGVPESTRDINHHLIHDDLITSSALAAKLDDLEWIIQTQSQTVAAVDPLKDMDRNF
jgi:hypothetical protein